MDEKRRLLARAVEQGDPRARAPALAERLRAGEVSFDAVRLAALLGDPAAMTVIGLDAGTYSPSLEAVLEALAPAPREVTVRAIVAIARGGASAIAERVVVRSRSGVQSPREVLDAVERWVLCPCDEHRGVVTTAGANDGLFSVPLAWFACMAPVWPRRALVEIVAAARAEAQPDELLSRLRSDLVPWVLEGRDPVRERAGAGAPGQPTAAPREIPLQLDERWRAIEPAVDPAIERSLEAARRAVEAAEPTMREADRSIALAREREAERERAIDEDDLAPFADQLLLIGRRLGSFLVLPSRKGYTLRRERGHLLEKITFDSAGHGNDYHVEAELRIDGFLRWRRETGSPFVKLQGIAAREPLEPLANCRDRGLRDRVVASIERALASFARLADERFLLDEALSGRLRFSGPIAELIEWRLGRARAQEYVSRWIAVSRKKDPARSRKELALLRDRYGQRE